MRKLLLTLNAVFLLLPASAEAHFNLLAPPSSNTANATEGGKGAPPCGPDSTASTAPVAIQGGKTFTLKINETVYHPGFYRVALALHSRSELPADPDVKTAVVNGTTQSVSAVATDMAFPIIANNLFADHKATGTQEAPLKIPNVNCDKCTLQVIEFMAQHGPNPGGGYFYHHCADLKITADPSLPLEHGDGGAGGGSSGGAGSSAGAGGSAGGSLAGTGGAATAELGGNGGNGGNGGSSGGNSSTGVSGGGVAGASTAIAGAPATAGSSSGAGASPVAGATGTPNSGDGADSGGCALNNHVPGSKPLFSLLLGLLVLGRRRKRR